MDIKKGSRIAVIGAGISGIAAANILKKNGFVPVVFEKYEKIGSVWATAYPEVHLQNIYTQYHLSDFDWSFKPDLHPTCEEIMKYLSDRHLDFPPPDTCAFWKDNTSLLTYSISHFCAEEESSQINGFTQ